MTRSEVLWRNRRTILVAWIAVVVIAAPLAAMQTKDLVGGGFDDADAGSYRVEKALDGNEFGGAQISPIAIVLVPHDDARPDDLRKAVGEISGEVEKSGGARVTPAERRAATEQAGGRPDRPVIVPLEQEGNKNLNETFDLSRDLREDLGIADGPGNAADGRVDVHLAGQGALWAAFQKVADKDARQAEGRAFPLIGLVLLLVFGSVAAALLPLALGMVAIVVTGAIVFLVSQVFTMSLFVSSIVSLIGIGVAIDYSLFVLVRYREEIKAGRDPFEARAVAMATSGRAVVFSGVTVLLSLCALFLIPSPGVRSMAVGAIAVVAVAVIGAATLMPILMGLLGPRAYEPGRLGKYFEKRRAGRPRRPAEEKFWARWSHAVMRRPVLSLVVATAVLLALASPALDMTVRNSATNQLPEDHELRDGVDAVSEVLGPGALGPAYIRIQFENGTASDPAGRQKLSELSAAVEGDRGIAYVNPPRQSDDGRSALLIGIPTSYPESPAARDTIDRLNADLPAVAGDDASIEVGGVTATILAFDRLATESLWRPILFVLALSFLVLLVVLRSVVLPLKAMFMNALSVGAAYGALVGVFQHGWLEWMGIDKSPAIYPLTMPLVLAVGFGLSMDYHIFLLSRIRERYLATGDNKRAVAEALTNSATAITSAALIMVVVFLAFVSAGTPSVQQLGFAAAVAIGVDATLVRLVIVPAAMELLGKWNWWLPRPLERILPTPSDSRAIALGEPAVAAATAGDATGQPQPDPAKAAEPSGTR
jgi:uncharacterized membrane protein YdfJ with MMPL/SSD domain